MNGKRGPGMYRIHVAEKRRHGWYPWFVLHDGGADVSVLAQGAARTREGAFEQARAAKKEKRWLSRRNRPRRQEG